MEPAFILFKSERWDKDDYGVIRAREASKQCLEQ